MAHWAGVDSIDPKSRGDAFDARKLAVLENFFGAEFQGSPNANSAPLLKSSYTKLFEVVYVSLISQAQLKDIVNSVSYDTDEISFEKAKQMIDVAISQDSVAGASLLSEFARAMKYYGLKNSKEFIVLRGYYAGKSAEYSRIIDFAGEQVLRGTASGEFLSVGSQYTLIDGDAGNDLLEGGNGDDTLIGGQGNDTLRGGHGDDLYIFNKGDGVDTVYDMNGLADEIRLNHQLQNVVFERRSNDLVVYMPGSLDSVVIDSWYRGNDYKIETFTSEDGRFITHTQIENLIQAMSTFQKDTGMTWQQALSSQPSQVESIVTQYWTAPTA